MKSLRSLRSFAAIRAALLAFLCVRADAATCKGKDPCTACRDCSRCQFCAVLKKGSCGVCRNQTSAQRAAAHELAARQHPAPPKRPHKKTP